MRKLIIILLFIASSFISCEKLILEKDEENTPVNNFDLLWRVIDRNYSFFEYKKINWDSLYNIYRPQVTNSLSDQELFDIMSTMLYELRDGHVNLYSDFGRSRNDQWYTAYPSNFNYDNLANNYLKDNFSTVGEFITTVIDSLGYVYIGSFSEEIRERDIDTIIARFGELKGIVIDVRHNSGGLSSNVMILASRFADKKRKVSYTLYKDGPGHGDFTSPQPNYVSPQGKKQFTGKVAVLTNRRVYSAANDFVLYMSAFPHVKIIGDTTGGGGGTPYDYELHNGWIFRITRTQTLAPDGFNVEHGIPPDFKENIRGAHERYGIDTILEAAIEMIINKAEAN